MVKKIRHIINEDFWLILALIVVGVIAQIVFLNPPILSDQMEYYLRAIELPRLPERADIASMRLGLLLPVAVLYRIFGHSELAYYGVPFLSTLILVVSVYLLGRGFFNRRVGFLAAIWLLFVPNLLPESGHLLPDIPAAAALTAGFALLVASHSRSGAKEYKHKNTWLFFLSGVVFGWAYMTKEYMAVLFVLIPILFWVLNIPFRRLIPTVLGMALVFGFETIVGLIFYQTPLVRFAAASPRETEGFIETDVGKIFSFLFILLNRRGGIGTILLGASSLVGSIFFAFKKKKAYIFLLVWSVLFFGFFTIIGLLPVLFSWEDIVLLRLHKFRYWVPILPPLILGGLAVLDQLLLYATSKTKLPDRFVPIIVSAIIGILLVASCWGGIIEGLKEPDLVRNGADHYLELRAFLKDHGDEVQAIWVTREGRRGYARILPIYTHDFWGRPIWEGTLKYLNTEGLFVRADEIEFGHVIIDRDFNDPQFSNLPLYLSKPPADWQIVFESENKKLALYDVE